MSHATHAIESIESEPTITRHYEAPEQGAQTYYRCECGREAMRRKDLRSEAHREECTA